MTPEKFFLKIFLKIFFENFLLKIFFENFFENFFLKIFFECLPFLLPNHVSTLFSAKVFDKLQRKERAVIYIRS